MSNIVFKEPHIIIFCKVDVSWVSPNTRCDINHEHARSSGYTHMPISQLMEQPFVTKMGKEELLIQMESVRKNGILNPVVSKNIGNGFFELINGAGRVACALEYNLKVPMLVNAWTWQSWIPTGERIKDTCEMQDYFYGGEHGIPQYMDDGCLSVNASGKDTIYGPGWRMGRVSKDML